MRSMARQCDTELAIPAFRRADRRTPHGQHWPDSLESDFTLGRRLRRARRSVVENGVVFHPGLESAQGGVFPMALRRWIPTAMLVAVCISLVIPLSARA